MPAGPDGELPEALQKLEPAILELVCNEIVEAGGRVQWDDIAGQDQAKRLVQELVVWPMLNPHLFKVPLLMHLERKDYAKANRCKLDLAKADYNVPAAPGTDEIKAGQCVAPPPLPPPLMVQGNTDACACL